MKFRAGDRVVVRNRDEILATLDSASECGKMPFMPEMLEHCGREYVVAAVAHKTCDTINKTGGRRIADAVHLRGVRCDGAAHGDCQAGCLVFWRTDWLRPVDGASNGVGAASLGAAGTVERLHAAAVRGTGTEAVYSCQATRLFDASQPLAWWDVRQYAVDVISGNVSVGRFLRVGVLRGIFHLRSTGVGYRAAVALYDAVHKALTGRASPYRPGVLPVGSPTPAASLNLSPGEWVIVKSHEEIRRTITEANVNRGMRFDPEMVRYCGQRLRVSRRVERLIDERTGRMLPMKSPCIVLDGAVCSSEYSGRRVFCPREIQPYFREIWLDRVPAGEVARD